MLQKAEIPMSIFSRCGTVVKAKEYVAKDIFAGPLLSDYCEGVYPVCLDYNGMPRRT